MKKTDINLKITNNTALLQTAELFNPLKDRDPATVIYEFDLSTENFIGIISFTQRYLRAPSPIGLSFSGGTVSSISELVSLLNTAGIGLYSFVGTTIYCTPNTDITLLDLSLG